MSKMSPLVILLLSVVLKQGSSIQYTPVIRITSGPIRGIVSQLNTGGTIRKYLGIPFAKAERFGKPTDPDPWTDLKDVNTKGKMCPQQWRKFRDMSEDCLNLNVFVPAGSGSSLSVMLWIHGGSFRTGSNNYDGSYLASLGGVIVVTINYRLNVFGFLATGKKAGDLKGNYGMLDQIHALTWVKDNIKEFGGNPNKVTIFGVSAGGASVSHLVLSPLAKGLFKNAIPQAGDATAEWAYLTYNEASRTTKLVGKVLGCENTQRLVECMKSKSIKDIVMSINKIRASGGRFAPVIGGPFQPEETPEAFLTKGNVKVNVLIGFNNDEGTVVTNAVKGAGSGFNVTNGFERSVFESALKGAKVNWLVRGQNKVINEAILYRYTDWDNVTDRYRNRRMLLDMLADVLFIAPAIKTARELVNKSVVTYVYQLQYRFSTASRPVPSWVGAYHAADKFIIFGQPFSLAAASNASVYTKDANFSRAVIRMWTNFAKTGDPNKPADIGIVWPQYDLKQQQFMALKPNMAVQAKLRNDYVAFWNSFVPAVLKSMPKPSPSSQEHSTGSVIVSGLMTAVLPILYAGLLP